MKYLNYYETQNTDTKNQILRYVIKIDRFDFNKILEATRNVVCLNQLDKDALIDQTILFVNEELQLIARAKLVKLITAPKQDIWNEIEKHTYLSKEKFNKMYKQSENATISVIYDLDKIDNQIKMPILKHNFIENVGFVIFES